MCEEYTVSQLIKKHSRLCIILDELLHDANTSLTNNSELVLQGYCKEINSYLSELRDLNGSIMCHHSDEVERYQQETSHTALRKWAVDTVNKIGELMRATPSLPSIPSVPNLTYSMPKLPRIQIPTFDGDVKKWTAFINAFDNLIHKNKSVGDFERLSYFKESLKGEAASLISHLQLTAENYSTAYKIITERYDNKRKIISEYLDTILNIPRVSSNSLKDVKNMHDTLKISLEALKSMHCSVHEWSPIIIHICLKKLDYNTVRQYEEKFNDQNNFPSLDEFLNLLNDRFNVLEALQRVPKVNKSDGYNRKSMVNRKPSNVGNVAIQDKKPHQPPDHRQSRSHCSYCDESTHNIDRCIHFKNISPNKRTDFTNRNQLCTRCLSHRREEKCLHDNKSCSVCKQPHHELLHDHSITKTVSLNSSPTNLKTILLSTALISVTSASGKVQRLRALIDQGSQVSLITQSAVSQLNLPLRKEKIKLQGVGEARNKSTAVAMLKIKPYFQSSFHCNVEAIVLPKITSDLPEHPLEKVKSSHQKLLLADPKYNIPAPIDILLGADVFADILCGDIVRGNPTAIETKLGWILLGPLETISKGYPVIANLTKPDEISDLNKYWELEEVSNEIPLSVIDQECEKIYQQTTTRTAEGRYIVNLPFQQGEQHTLGLSKQRAIQRFLQVEKRLQGDDNLKQLYTGFMKEYQVMGHMEEARFGSGKYYIPHHAVFKDSSMGPKIRVVFDASMKTSTGVSLNDILHTGPSLQSDIWTILLRWRQYRYVFSADIVKMFRQIEMSKLHQPYQRIIWRDDPKKPLKEYSLTTITYGTSSAPYLAIRTLLQLVKDEGINFPLACSAILNDIYVDDILAGGDSLQHVELQKRQLIELLKRGGCELSRWSANQPTLLASICPDNRLNGSLDFNDDVGIKTLGILWNPKSDTFYFNVNLPPTVKGLTKRQFASEASRQFDPLGWLAPITVTVKIMFQQIWELKCDWDEELPSHMVDQWKIFKNELQTITAIRIVRWIGCSIAEASHISLHGFCDASEKAYGAVIYMRLKLKDDTVIIRLLTAKTKVAPIRIKQTLPRLELCAALLLARLMDQTSKVLEGKITNHFLWSDSQITLAWIQKPPNNWKTFVAHRVAEIQKLTSIQNWRHVNSENNPADAASRGIRPNKLEALSIWWNGPQFLANYENIPSNLPTTNISTECRKHKVCHLAIDLNDSVVGRLLHRKSSFTKILHIIARILQILKKNKTASWVELVRSAEIKVIQFVQGEAFPNELQALRNGNPLSRSSALLALTPYLDNERILRVGGRLENANCAYNTKHPVILPKSHRTVDLIIMESHIRNLHAGPSVLLNILRQRFWILSCHQTIKRYIKSCVICCRHRSKTLQQLMGNLPPHRLVQDRPFTITGVDYAGPIHLRSKIGRGKVPTTKGYIALFICFSTKAVHIELVSDMTTECYLAALRRFVARRGKPTEIMSDNGTNFVGAKRETNEMFQNFQKAYETVVTELADQAIKFSFVPPGAPHFGGLWESNIKSIKFHVKRVTASTTFTFEEMTTLLCQIEGILNSRPLCRISSDSENLDYLTPGHFLIGAPLLAIPEPSIEHIPIPRLSRWQNLQQRQQGFWRRWSSEYIHTLQQRPKWRTQQNNLEPGNVVLIKEDNLPPSHWLLGKIIVTHAGTDDLVRAVTIRTKNGEIKRPITKLCLLPIESSECTSKEEPQRLNQSLPPKTRKTRSSRLLTMYLAMLCCMVHIGFVASVKLIALNSSGLMFVHDSTRFIQLGVWELEIITNLNVTRDIQTINYQVQQLEDLCHLIWKARPRFPCGERIHIMYQETRILESHLRVKSRTKRSRGILGVLKDIFLGTDEEEEIDMIRDKQDREFRRFTDVLGSSLKTVEQQETNIQTEMNNFQSYMETMSTNLNQVANWTDNINEAILHTSFNDAFESATSVLQLLNSEYHDAELARNINPRELTNLTEIIKATLPPALILPRELLTVKGLQKLKSRTYIKNHLLTITFDIPVIHQEPFEEFYVISVPNLHNHSRIEVFHDTIAVSHKLDLYFYPKLEDITMRLNDSTINKLQLLHRGSSSTDCIAASIFKNYAITNVKCQFQPVTSEDDIWCQLSSPSSYFYWIHDPTAANLTCNSSRIDIIHPVGLLHLDADCSIKTNKHLIFAEINRHSALPRLYFQPSSGLFNLTDELLPNLSTIKMLQNNTFSVDDEAYNELRKEVENLSSSVESPNHPMWFYINIGTSLCLVILIIVWLMWWFCYIRQDGYCHQKSPVQPLTHEPLLRRIHPARPECSIEQSSV